MKTTYQLPCPCGRTIPVEPRQAGEMVQCACGKTVQTPTWREMTALERSGPAEAPVAPHSGWGGPQRLCFLGAVLLLIAAVVAVGVYQTRPVPPRDRNAPEMLQADVERMTPLDSVRVFHHMVESGLSDRSKDPWQQAYQAARDRYLGWLVVPALLGAAGFVLLGLGAVLAAKSRGKVS